MSSSSSFTSARPHHSNDPPSPASLSEDDLLNPWLPSPSSAPSPQPKQPSQTHSLSYRTTLSPSAHTPSTTSDESRDLVGGNGKEEDGEAEPLVGPLGAKAIASITGAVATSLLMTPFDVLKTRLQTVRPNPTILPSTNPAPGPGCCQTAVLPPNTTFSELGLGTKAEGAGASNGVGVAGPGPGTMAAQGMRNGQAGEVMCLSSTLTNGMEAAEGNAGNGRATIIRNPFSSASVESLARGSGNNPILLTTSSPVPAGCLAPSRWAGIWGEIITIEEAETLRRAGVAMGSGFGMEEVRNLGAKFGIGSGSGMGNSLSGSGSAASAEAIANAHKSFVSELRTILAEPAGWRGLWKGVGTGLVMSIPSASIYMLGYEYLLGWMGRAMDRAGGAGEVVDADLGREEKLPETLSDVERAVEELRRRGEFPRGDPGYRGRSRASETISPQHTVLSLSLPSSDSANPSTSDSFLANVPASTQQAYLSPIPFMAGSAARTISATVISPIELFRTRLQALPGPGEAAPSYSSTFASINKMVQKQGLRSLWRGLGPTLWRDVPFSGMYWAGFESLKRYFTESQIISPGIGLTFTSGALSGTMASLVTSPFDVLKTRRQVFTPSSTCSIAALNHPASTMPLLMHVVKTEGWKALFAGVVPRTAKVAPACGLMIASYEGVGKLLGGKDGSRA